jgi:hypothetical protein
LKFYSAVLVIFSLAVAGEGDSCSEIELPFFNGVYQLGNFAFKNVPSLGQNGSSWDSSDGAPDLYLEFYTVNGADTLQLESTVVIDDSSLSGTWEQSYTIYLYESSGEDSKLVFTVWDSDVEGSEFVDSGETSFSDLVTNGMNTLVCEHGTFIFFEIYWLGLE